MVRPNAVRSKFIFIVVVLMAWNSIVRVNSVDMFDVEGLVLNEADAPGGRRCTHGDGKG